MQAQLAQGGPGVRLSRSVQRNLSLAGQHSFQIGVPTQPAQKDLQVAKRLGLAARHARHLTPQLDRPFRVGQ